METPNSWKTHIESIVASPGMVVVVGAVDTGKTSLCALLSNESIAAGIRTGVVDGDLGQSEIGPPATIGLGFPESEIQSISEIRSRSLYFVGSTTPVGNLLPTAVGMKWLAERAKDEGADMVIADTSGFVSGPTARRLKTYKIELLKPRHIVAIQRAYEAEHFLRLFDTWEDCEIHRLTPSTSARAKPKGLRAQRRVVRFQRYFSSASEKNVVMGELTTSGTWLGTGESLEPRFLRFAEKTLGVPALHGEIVDRAVHIVVKGAPPKSDYSELQEHFGGKRVRITSASQYVNLLIGLHGSHMELLAMGLVRSIDFSSMTMSVLTPLRSLTPALSVWFGVARVRPDGVEIGQLRPGDV